MSGSGHDSIKVWCIADGACIRTMTGHTSTVSSVCITPDQRYVVSGRLYSRGLGLE